MELPEVSQNVEQRLEILVRVATILGLDDLSFSSYSGSMTRLSTELLSLKRSLNYLNLAEGELQIHLASARHERRLIDKWRADKKHEEETGEGAVTLERRREVLLKKAKEYHRNLDTLLANMSDTPSITVTRLTRQQEKNKLKEQELKVKRAKIKTFQGLAPNLELARHELRNARDEQMKLIQLRERLLGKMAGSVI